MDSLLEEVRNLHEERDKLEMDIVEEMLAKKAGHKERIDSEHRQKILLQKYMSISGELLKYYENIGNKSPVATIDVKEGGDMTNAITDFYISLKRIREISSDEPSDPSVLIAATAAPSNDIDPEHEASDPSSIATKPAEPEIKTNLVEFTDEEAYGRYLDLTQCHEAFLQVIKREEVKPNYLAFLDKFDHFADIERELKLSTAYTTYVQMMLDYFRDYSRRAKPLFDYESFEAKTHAAFVKQWDSKAVPGWFTEADREKATNEPMIELESYKSHDQLMELGLDCLKSELQVRGLKCGGSLEERAKRLWAVRGKSPEEIDASLKAVPVLGKKGKRKSTIEPYSIAAIEAKILAYAGYYTDYRAATIENVQRKQARTVEERNESDEDLSDIEEEENDGNNVIYNPKNLPLGWDDKPIPYWLYKLHGLNLTFTCEICGNATYKGPKTFQRHFAEWRHANGMRCLGIPNTAHFANITKIEDAISLWEKLKAEKHKDGTQVQNDEEFEDSRGNVVNKKTYEDLKRQGLL